MSFSDEWYEHEVNRLNQIHKKERAIRDIRHAELQDSEHMDEFERRLEVQQIQFDRIVHGIELMATSLNKLLYDYRAVNTKQGLVYGNYFQILQTAQVMQIDFKRPGGGVNIPAGTRFDIPGQPISNIIIINYGTGDLQFSFPGTSNDLHVGSILKAPAASTNPVPLVLNFGEPIVERMNLFASGGNLNVNLFVTA